MAQSKITQELLALGGRLVEQFKLREDEDTLGQWIAHHLAEKLMTHKSASGPAKAVLEADLVDTILRFWKHRAYFPRGTRPFEGYDAVLRALESLDPNPGKGRYFQYRPADNLKKDAKPPSEAWIDAAKAFDRGARAIVNFCFQQAARASGQPDEVWLSAAKVLAEDADRDIIVVKFIKTGAKDDEIDPIAFERKQLERKRDDLRSLISGGIPILRLIENHLEGFEIEPATSNTSRSKPKPLTKSKSTAVTKTQSSTKRPSKKAKPKNSKKKTPARQKRAATGS
jgi:hypothetical protein